MQGLSICREGLTLSAGASHILHERILEVSREPAQETGILVAHGEKTDEETANLLH